MQQNENDREKESPSVEDKERLRRDDDHDPEHPTPDIEHYPEPDAENLIPVKDRPGTL